MDCLNKNHAMQSRGSWGSGTNQPNFFDITGSPNAHQQWPTFGIHMSESYGLIENNEFRNHSTAISAEECPSFTMTEVLDNVISAETMGIDFYAIQVTTSRIRIIDNIVSAGHTGIRVSNYHSTDLNGSNTDKVFINFNDVSLTAPQNATDIRRGIVLDNGYAHTVGNNFTRISGTYMPTALYDNVFGIGVIKSQYCEIAGNDISRFNQGLVLENDNGTSKFWCNNFDRTYHGVLYRDINIPTSALFSVNNHNNGGGNTASNNTFTNHPNNVNRVFFQSVNVNQPANWYYAGTTTNQSNIHYPLGLDPSIILYSSNATTVACINLPSSKTEDTLLYHNQLTEAKWIVYPNPTSGYFSVSNNLGLDFDFKIFTPHGKLVMKSHVRTSEHSVEHDLPSGMYYVKILIDGKEVGYEKIVVAW